MGNNHDSLNSWTFAAAVVTMLLLSLGIFWATPRIVEGVFNKARPKAVAALVIECAAIGAIVMVSIQAVRNVYPVRGAFHRLRATTWLQRGNDFHSQLESELAKEPVLSNYLPLRSPHGLIEGDSKRLSPPGDAVASLLELLVTFQRSPS